MSTLDWLCFQQVYGYGATRAQKALDAYHHPSLIPDLHKGRPQLLANAERLLEQAVKLGCTVLTPDDARYPQRLRNIYAPPAVLFVLGSLSALADDRPAIAMVGTRKITPYGKRVAQELSAGLAQAGVTVVSGMALGVDAISHWAALRAGGPTVAVLGNGLDTIYPASNQELHQAVLQSGGAVVSEFPPGEAPLPFHFPIRNRIISGLSLGVVVVEGARHSGSLLTAGHAVTQDREVFAVPGEIYANMSQATNWLIGQGATMATCVGDILAQFPYIRFGPVAGEDAPPAAQTQLELPDTPEPLPDYLSDNQRRVLTAMGHQPLPADRVAAHTGLAVGAVLAAFTQLELFGLVRACPGQCYQRLPNPVK